MMVVGGRILGSAGESEEMTDPWKQGIGIFDMSAFAWSDSYNASAATYVTPNVVKTYYQQSSRYPSSWVDSDVQGWFEKSSK